MNKTTNSFPSKSLSSYSNLLRKNSLIEEKALITIQTQNFINQNIFNEKNKKIDSKTSKLNTNINNNDNLKEKLSFSKENFQNDKSNNFLKKLKLASKPNKLNSEKKDLINLKEKSYIDENNINQTHRKKTVSFTQLPLDLLITLQRNKNKKKDYEKLENEIQKIANQNLELNEKTMDNLENAFLKICEHADELSPAITKLKGFVEKVLDDVFERFLDQKKEVDFLKEKLGKANLDNKKLEKEIELLKKHKKKENKNSFLDNRRKSECVNSILKSQEADISIINDSEESSFNFFGKTEEISDRLISENLSKNKPLLINLKRIHNPNDIKDEKINSNESIKHSVAQKLQNFQYIFKKLKH